MTDYHAREKRRQKTLSVRQERFADAMVAGAPTASDAVRKAGYSTHPPSVWVQGSRLLRDAQVQAAIVEKRESQRDSARSLLSRSLARAHVELPKQGADYALKAAGVAAVVIEKTAGDDETPSRMTHTPEEWRVLIERSQDRAYRAGFMAAMAGNRSIIEQMSQESYVRARFRRRGAIVPVIDGDVVEAEIVDPGGAEEVERDDR